MELLISCVLMISIVAFFLFVAARPTRPVSSPKEEENALQIQNLARLLQSDIDALRSDIRSEFTDIKQLLSQLEVALSPAHITQRGVDDDSVLGGQISSPPDVATDK
jgi:hypothetical protein